MDSSRKDILLHTQITKALGKAEADAQKSPDQATTEHVPPTKPRPRLPAYVHPH